MTLEAAAAINWGKNGTSPVSFVFMSLDALYVVKGEYVTHEDDPLPR
jgi:hypothetical protein